MANAFKTEQVESMDQLSKDKEFCAYVGGIAKRHREKYGSVLYRRIPNNHFDYYQEAWIAICEAWKNKPKQTKGFYSTAVEYHFQNERRLAMAKKRGKGLPEVSLDWFLDDEIK